MYLFEITSNPGWPVACENSRSSSLPVRVAFRVKDLTQAGSEEGRLFSQARWPVDESTADNTTVSPVTTEP